MKQREEFCLGDHVIFRDFSGKDMYGVIINLSPISDNHLRIAADDGSSWHVEKENLGFIERIKKKERDPNVQVNFLVEPKKEK